MKQCGKHLQKNFEIADYVKSSRSVRLVEEANKLTAPSELLGIYRKFGDYPVSQHGAQALWGRETMAGMADGGPAAYGMPVGGGGRLVGTPSFGIGTSEYGRDYRLGYGLTVAQGGAMHFDLGVYSNRREVGIADQTGTRDVGIGDCQEHTAVILSFFSSSPVSRVRLSVTAM